MKIKWASKEKKATVFSDLTPGTVFKIAPYSTLLFLKIPDARDSNNGDASNCVNLATGLLMYTTSNCNVVVDEDGEYVSGFDKGMNK